MTKHFIMNRREMLSSAAAFIAAPSMAFGQTAGVQENPSEPSKRFLVPLFTEAMLQKQLIGPQQWRPFAKASDREAWQTVPDDVRSTLISAGNAGLKAGWAVLPASLFLGFHDTGNRTEYEAFYFRRRQQLRNLVLAECMEGKGRLLSAIADGVWLICEESFWGLPAHLGMQKAGTGLPDVQEPIIDLFAGDTAGSLSVVHYLLGAELDKVSPMISKRVSLEIQRRFLGPGLQRTDFSWMGFSAHRGHLNNWTPWICSNWIMTNFLMETERNRQVNATRKICQILDYYIESLSPDGGCDEGPGYWSVAAGSYVDCILFCRQLQVPIR